jgi:hypothetical protein
VSIGKEHCNKFASYLSACGIEEIGVVEPVFGESHGRGVAVLPSPRTWRGDGVMNLVGIAKVGVQAKSVTVISARNGVRRMDTTVVVSPGAFGVRLVWGCRLWVSSRKGAMLEIANCCAKREEGLGGSADRRRAI